MKTLISSQWSKRILWLSIIITFSICTYIVLFIGTANTKHDDICLHVFLISLFLLLVRFFLMEYWKLNMPPAPQELKKMLAVLTEYKELHVVELLKENDMIADKCFATRYTHGDESIIVTRPPWTEKWTVQIKNLKDETLRVYDSDGLRYADDCEPKELIPEIVMVSSPNIDALLQNIRNFIDEPKEFPAIYSFDELENVYVSFSLNEQSIFARTTEIPISAITMINANDHSRVHFKNETVFPIRVNSDVSDLFELSKTKEYEGFKLEGFYLSPRHSKIYPNMQKYGFFECK